jgi:hypothetical protein
MADSAIYSAEKLMKEQGDKVPEEAKRKVEVKVEAVKKSLEGENINTIRQATAELSGAIQELGASMYEQPGAAPPPPEEGDSETGPTGTDEDVIEGEFSET